MRRRAARSRLLLVLFRSRVWLSRGIAHHRRQVAAGLGPVGTGLIIGMACSYRVGSVAV